MWTGQCCKMSSSINGPEGEEGGSVNFWSGCLGSLWAFGASCWEGHSEMTEWDMSQQGLHLQASWSNCAMGLAPRYVGPTVLTVPKPTQQINSVDGELASVAKCPHPSMVQPSWLRQCLRKNAGVLDKESPPLMGSLIRLVVSVDPRVMCLPTVQYWQ